MKTTDFPLLREKIVNSHTILFALLPAVTLFAINLREFVFPQIIRSLAVLSIAAVLLLRVGWLRFRDIERAALLSSLLLSLFMYYGHAYNLLIDLLKLFASLDGITIQINGISYGAHFLILLVWIGFIVAGIRLAGRGNRWKRRFTQFLFLLSIIFILFPAVTIVDNWGAIVGASEPLLFGPEIESALHQSNGPHTPDIYYIVLDAYGREDILEEFYAYDNSTFTNQLKDFGFYVARDSRSNYSNTNSSLASSLNMTYLDQGLDLPSDDLHCARYLAQVTASSRVITILRELGYQIVSFETGFRSTENANADLYLHSVNKRLNAFENLLLQNSFLSLIFDLSSTLNGPFEYPRYAAHRDRIAFTLDNVSKLGPQSQPRFVFAHIVAPHPPFVFDATGKAVDQRIQFGIGDGDYFPGTREEYINGYSNQLTYLNAALLEIVQELTQDPVNQPVIIIQGDHGPRLVMEWSHPSADAKREGMAILNAYYMPDVDKSQLYDEISPVNSFRVLFNAYFNAGFDLLPDQSYMMAHGCQDQYSALPAESELLDIQE